MAPAWVLNGQGALQSGAMKPTHLIDSLNDAQRAAVSASASHVMVLAGAGSGKTRVLTHRLAWFVETGQATPGGILAVTFTNKAANEMRARVEQLLTRTTRGMWIGTFHGIANRMLRAHHREAGLPETFQIMDSDDQVRFLRRLIRDMQLDDAQWSPKEAAWFINARKEEGQRADHIETVGDSISETLVSIYRRYDTACREAGVVDFAELLLRSHELLRERPAMLEHYQTRFRHILVDEFQDTNAIQYAWLRLLAGTGGELFVVGDDDQSIYSWRGARVANMLAFERDYPGTEMVRLEQNYRSTRTILAAANALIANNTTRLGKELWSDGEQGQAIRLYRAFNDIDEARFTAADISRLHEEGVPLAECALLYRTSAQSRVLEDALRAADLPYRVYGGFRFYERAEIKDALAYLRLAVFRADDTAFDRIINVPARGIGQRTVEAIREAARADRVPLWEAARRLVAGRELGGRAVNAVAGFLQRIDDMGAAIDGLPLGEQMQTVLDRSGLPQHFAKERGERAVDRTENLEELVIAARDFRPSEEMEDMSPVAAFLAQAALEAGEGQADAHTDCVQLMTLHAAKGLEFTAVYLLGLEEGLFPHQRSAEDPAQLEEERRLCYVGMTRAERYLTLCHAEVRRLHGSDFYPAPSRFLRELPTEHIAEVRGAATLAAPAAVAVSGAVSGQASGDREPPAHGLTLGMRVAHATFGEGVVLGIEGRGEYARVHVNFESVGAKWLVAAYAGLCAV